MTAKSGIERVEAALARATDPAGEGSRTFILLDADGARLAAEAADAAGGARSPVAGMPVSVKDVFDVAGQVTTAGCPSRRDHAAAADAPAIGRLRRAGAVIMGRTNMSELSFSVVGTNPHYGTPANPYDRTRRLVPGGSSSGAAVSVSDGMAEAAIATDSGGSIRIPAALCGLAGFKPTQCRVPLDGVLPLSPTLDSVGVIATGVAGCAAVDAVLAGEGPGELESVGLAARMLAIPRNFFVAGLDPHVAACFQRAISTLSAAGLTVRKLEFPQLREVASAASRSGFAPPESYGWHRNLGPRFDRHDPMTRERLLHGETFVSGTYLNRVAARTNLIRGFNQAHAAVDLILCPTVPLTAPAIERMEADPDEFGRVNTLLLRNCVVVNFLDRCALTLPCHLPGEAPVGLMLIGRHMEDRFVLAAGLAIERLLRQAV